MPDFVTDVAQKPTRVLKKQYDAAGTAKGTVCALPVNAPATFGGVEVAMGYCGKDGLLSFVHDFDPDTDITGYYHSATWELIDPPSKGWLLCAESTALNTKACLKKAHATLKMPGGAAFFLKAGAAEPVVNCMVSGTEHPRNPNTDLTITP